MRWLAMVCTSALVLMLAACGGGGSSAGDDAVVTGPVGGAGGGDGDAMDTALRALIDREGLNGDAAFNRTLPQISDPLAVLGRQLFFSQSLGGEFDSACVSCHHPMLGGADALVLPVGVGALSPELIGPGRRDEDGVPDVPRNSPTVFNVGLWDSGLFWDSRVESFGKEAFANGSVSAIRTPDVPLGDADTEAGPNLPAAQARFPVTSMEEMRGEFLLGADNATLRNHLAERLGGYGSGVGVLDPNEWLAAFQTAFASSAAADELITYDNIALALAEYARSMVFVRNPFSAYVEGDLDALST